ncbi:RAMP superfamily CRISPR-associated protein [Azoarcus sp. PA01]|nr:RAMP superfamily CRISPR-associated protein [Azoarcus sp. PA01]KON82498.1 RAMP superfamily CRISPR-associated protein [Azoarcus sp. PA01]
MTVARSHFCLARVTLEALSAHGIHSGQGDATHDVLLVRDANHLPALPGTSLAGVLRHAYQRRHGERATHALFGVGGEQAQASSLNVAWALVHDSANRPVEGLRTDLGTDPLLARLLDDKPLVRQRVRLDHTGTASSAGKFDVTLIPAGVRYTGWLSFWGDGSDASRMLWWQLLELLNGSVLHLGHGTRSGNGHFEVVELLHAEWNVAEPVGREAFVARPRSRAQRGTLAPFTPSGQAPARLEATLKLRAEAGWRVGGGEQSLNAARYDKQPDLLPQHEIRVHWNGDEGRLGTQHHLLPASAIKGALRHRVAYHYRCLTEDFAQPDARHAPEHCPAVSALFGHAQDDEGRAGVLAFHDVVIHDAQCVRLMHNRIDRYTGGVINGALFSEEVLWQTPLELRIELWPDAAGVDRVSRQALARALDDLACGWLPLGANGSRGLGVFVGDGDSAVRWSDGGHWIHGAADMELAA